MDGLRSLQMAFAEAVYCSVNERVAARIMANGLDSARRVQVYRNNTFAGLTGALEAVYPVVQRLVGADYLRFAAEEYIRDHPSLSGNLHHFGDRFAEFLTTLPSAAGLPYLPDMARLEWAYHEVFHAGSASRLDLEGLQDLSAANYLSAANWERLGFNLHPASRLIASSYPVLRIWQVNQDGYEGDQAVDLTEGGVRVLMLRRELHICLYRLSAGEYVWLTALAAGHDITRAYEQARAREPDFDLNACLQSHVTRGTLVDWYLTDKEPLTFEHRVKVSTLSAQSKPLTSQRINFD
jgi:hypothetical protein